MRDVKNKGGSYEPVPAKIHSEKSQAMKRYFFLILSAVWAINLLQAQSTEFIQPWNDTTRAIIIDAYYLNDINWKKMATDTRVAAVIHKASEGLKTDSRYS